MYWKYSRRASGWSGARAVTTMNPAKTSASEMPAAHKVDRQRSQQHRGDQRERQAAADVPEHDLQGRE